MRRYRWGKFQGWTTAVIGLLTWIPLFRIHFGVKWLAEFIVSIVLIFLGLGLVQKRRFALVLLYIHLPIFILAFVFLSLPAPEVVFAVCWYFIPAIFYYPKRWKEFSAGSDIAGESASTAVSSSEDTKRREDRQDLCYTSGIMSAEKPRINNLRSASSALVSKLKSAGIVVLGIIFFLAIIAALGVILGGVTWLSQGVLPWFARLAVLAFLALILLLLPLSLIRKCRQFTSTAILIVSYVFGITVWMDGLVLTMTLWGTGAVVLGVFFMGVGFVPIAMLATLFHGMWVRLAELVALTVLTFGSRFFAFWIIEYAGHTVKKDRKGAPAKAKLTPASPRGETEHSHADASRQAPQQKLPDLGKYLASKGTPQKTSLVYTTWEIDDLAVVGPGRYCTTRIQPLDGNLYCATFDFGADMLEQILARAPAKTRALVARSLAEDPDSVRHLRIPNPINLGIVAILGSLQHGMHETFIPLVITEVFGDDPTHVMETMGY
jgi:hypothetical protein